VRCAIFYTLLFLCPNNLFRQFLVHKILASKYICENGKKKREKKKRKNFPANWAGGEFWPKRRQRERAVALSVHLAQPRGAMAGERRCGAGLHAREGGGNGVNGTEGGKGSTGAGRRRALRRFSAVGPVLRWGSGGGAWAVDGVMGVGRISPAGAYGGRSATRWRVPAAVLPPVRFPATIEWGKWRAVTVRVWRSSWHNLIEWKIAREGRGELTGAVKGARRR
jgi:hypothetical protein